MNILTKLTQDKGNTPKDILMIRNLIEGEGIEEYEKNTLNFVSEYLNSYIVDILSESKQYALYAERHKITIEDVKMAVKLKSDTFYTKKPDQIYLKELAREVNSIQLSNIPDNPQILLPPPEHALIRNNFQIFSEEILQNLSNEQNKQETSDTKLEDELKLSTTKRHSMIGLKRRDYDDRPNVVLSKKKMRLSANSHIEDRTEFSHKGNYEESSHTQSHSNKHTNNIQTQKGSNSYYQSREEHDDNIFDHEEDEMMNRHGNFLQGDGSDMEDYNYDNFS